MDTADREVTGSIDGRFTSLPIGEPLARALSVRTCIRLSAGSALHVCPRPGEADFTDVPDPPNIAEPPISAPAETDTPPVPLGRSESSGEREMDSDFRADKVP